MTLDEPAAVTCPYCKAEIPLIEEQDIAAVTNPSFELFLILHYEGSYEKHIKGHEEEFFQKLDITAAADADLNKAADYIDHILLNPQAADDLLDEAERQINDPSTFPEKYSLVEDPVLNAWGIRLTLVKDYLAFYVISEDEKRVYIVRFLHSRQNWAAILRHGFSFE